jgi:D-alanyl-D-alanine carboxypeptidase
MNHTSGIPDFILELKHVLDYFQDLMKTFTTEEYLEYICGDDANFEAGMQTEYSNTNTVLLALIMDEIAGNHADVISKKIIDHLDLKNTFYKNEKEYPAPKGSVNTYFDLKGNGKMVNSTEYERNFAKMNIGHDGMLASAYDYYLFIEALFSGKILSQESLDEMIKYESYPSAVKRGEGLGLEITEAPLGLLTRMGHNGGSLGAANNVFYYPEKDTYIITCSNYGDFIDGPLNALNWSGLVGNQQCLLGELELLLFE